MEVQLVSPEQVLYVGEADMVIARTLGGGEIAFLKGHAPFLGALDDSSVRLKLEDGGQERFAVHGGFVEVTHDRVIILSDVAELAADIDVDRARGEGPRRRGVARQRRRRRRAGRAQARRSPPRGRAS